MPLFCIFTGTTAVTQLSFIVWKKTPVNCVWLITHAKVSLTNKHIQHASTRPNWNEMLWRNIWNRLSFLLSIGSVGKDSPSWPCIWMTLNDYLEEVGWERHFAFTTETVHLGSGYLLFAINIILGKESFQGRGSKVQRQSPALSVEQPWYSRFPADRCFRKRKEKMSHLSW